MDSLGILFSYFLFVSRILTLKSPILSEAYFCILIGGCLKFMYFPFLLVNSQVPNQTSTTGDFFPFMFFFTSSNKWQSAAVAPALLIILNLARLGTTRLMPCPLLSVTRIV